MADEYKLGPFHLDYDITEVYDGASTYFTRTSEQFRVTAKHFDDEDRFSIDFTRNYSFIASEYRATVHLRAREAEEGGTDLFYDIKSNQDEEQLRSGICDRITDGIISFIKRLREEPIEGSELTEEEVAAENKKERNKLIALIIVAAIIVIGCIPVASTPSLIHLF